MAGNFTATPIPQTALNARKMKLNAPNAAGKMAGWSLRLHGNNFRMQVYTNDPNDPVRKAITASMSPIIFFVMLEMIKDAINAPGKYQNVIKNEGFKYNGQQRSEKPETLSRTHIFKDEAGIIYISIVENGRPNIKFPLINDQWHSFVDSEGNAMDKGVASQLTARGFYRMWSNIAAVAMVHYFTEEEQKEKPGGNGGGNRNWNNNSGGGGGQGGGNRSSGGSSGGDVPSDEDIPW